MVSWRELGFRIRDSFRFTSQELGQFFLAVVILAFAIGFDDGSKTFEFTHWLFNLVNVLLLTFVVLFVGESSRKIYALSKGYTSTFKFLPATLLIGFALSLASRGQLWYLILPGTMLVSHIAGARIGEFRYGLNYFDLGKIALASSFGVMLLAMVFKSFGMLLPGNALLTKGVYICIAYSVSNLLPIPPIPGHHMFYASKIAYAFSVFFITLLGLFLVVLNPIASIIIAGCAAVLLGGWYVYFFELK